MDLIFYCRSGYEADLLGEVEHACAKQGLYGYAKLTKNSAELTFTMPQISAANTPNAYAELNKKLPALEQLVFARQKLLGISELRFETNDRVSEILTLLENHKNEYANLPAFTDVFTEYADTEDGKQMAKFCKKFAVPLRNQLRKAGLLSKQAHKKGAYLHLIFSDSTKCTLAISLPHDRSEHHLGIQRLKMPNEAPSRSTLKLEEAIKLFCSPQQEAELFSAGMRAVDLGACPGGWSYQLVQRKVTVEAVDHGEIQAELMATGLVEYYSEDGFLYQPQQGNVDWLVCDMIEQPTRVSELMLHWLVSGLANAAIFNLKLPMNKRFKVVQPILDNLNSALSDKFGHVVIKAKHLYHNRDEVTVFVIVNSQLLSAYNHQIK